MARSVGRGGGAGWAGSAAAAPSGSAAAAAAPSGSAAAPAASAAASAAPASAARRGSAVAAPSGSAPAATVAAPSGVTGHPRSALLPALPPGHPTTVSARGYGVLKAGLPEAALRALREATTVSPAAPPMGQPPKSFSVTRESASKIYLPMYLGLGSYGAPGERRLPASAPMGPGAKFAGSLREGQAAPVAAYMEAARDPLRRGGVINMVCAAGKTVMALYLACALGRKTLVIVHKEFLMSQWRERIGQFVPGASVGRIQGPVFDVEGRDVVLCMLQTLAARGYDLGGCGFGLAIVDECHHTSAEVFSRGLHSVNFEHALGLSATIRRKDGLGHVFQWFLGPVVYRSKRAREAGVRVEVWEFQGGDPEYRREVWMHGQKLNMARMVSNVCGHLPRTEFIARRAAAAAGAGRKTLVLSERRAHLLEIERCIREASGGSASVGYYVGGMKEGDLKASEGRSVVLGTYAMAAEGMDIPSLNTLILASPKTDIEQSVGRVLRVRADARTVEPLVVDVADPFSVFAAQARRRAAYYGKCGYTVRRMSEGGASGGALFSPAPELQNGEG